MTDYKLEIKQIVDYPECRIYRQFIQSLIADRNIRTSGCSGLFIMRCFAATSPRRSCRTSMRSSTSFVRISATSAPEHITGSERRLSRYSARCCGDIPRRIARKSCGSFCSKLNFCGRDTRKNTSPVMLLPIFSLLRLQQMNITVRWIIFP